MRYDGNAEELGCDQLLNDRGSLEYMLNGAPALYTPMNGNEIAVILVLIDKEYRGLTNKERADVVGVHWKTFYKIKARAEVKAVISYLVLENFKDKQAELLDASYKYGMADRRNFADRKLCAEIMGLKRDTKEVNINKKTMNMNVSVGSATTEELENMVKEMIRKDPACLPREVLQEMIRKDPTLIPLEIEGSEVIDE